MTKMKAQSRSLVRNVVHKTVNLESGVTGANASTSNVNVVMV